MHYRLCPLWLAAAGTVSGVILDAHTAGALLQAGHLPVRGLLSCILAGPSSGEVGLSVDTDCIVISVVLAPAYPCSHATLRSGHLPVKRQLCRYPPMVELILS